MKMKINYDDFIMIRTFMLKRLMKLKEREKSLIYLLHDVPLPQEWIENYDNELQKILDEYISYNNVLNNHFTEVFNWQQDIIQNALMWNYLRKKSIK